MRTLMLALGATTMAIPASFALPTDGAEAQYRYKEWRGRDGRTYCRRKNGTVGLVVGAAGGALVGRALDGGRNRATGTILGAGAGALLGREVARGKRRCR